MVTSPFNLSADSYFSVTVYSDNSMLRNEVTLREFGSITGSGIYTDPVTALKRAVEISKKYHGVTVGVGCDARVFLVFDAGKVIIRRLWESFYTNSASEEYKALKSHASNL